MIELIINEDPNTTGHLFCTDCATELNVVLTHSKIYINPQYKKNWDTPWHEFHNVKFVHPDMVEIVSCKDIMSKVVCPYCSAVGKIVTMDNFDKAMFSIRPSITESVVNYYKEISKDLGTGVSKKDKSEKDIQYT